MISVTWIHCVNGGLMLMSAMTKCDTIACNHAPYTHNVCPDCKSFSPGPAYIALYTLNLRKLNDSESKSVSYQLQQMAW